MELQFIRVLCSTDGIREGAAMVEPFDLNEDISLTEIWRLLEIRKQPAATLMPSESFIDLGDLGECDVEARGRGKQ